MSEPREEGSVRLERVRAGALQDIEEILQTLEGEFGIDMGPYANDRESLRTATGYSDLSGLWNCVLDLMPSRAGHDTDLAVEIKNFIDTVDLLLHVNREIRDLFPLRCPSPSP